MNDEEILDWIDRNLCSLHHDRQTCSVDMSGNRITICLENEARGTGGGPSTIRIRARSIREAIEKAATWVPSDGRIIE